MVEVANPVMEGFGPYNTSTGEGWNTAGPLWYFPGSGRPGVNQGSGFKYLAQGGGGTGGTGAASRYAQRLIPSPSRYQILAARIDIFHFTRNLGNAQAGMYITGLDANGNTIQLRIERDVTAGKMSIIYNAPGYNQVRLYESDAVIQLSSYNYYELLYDKATHSVRWRINRREQPGGPLPPLSAPLPNPSFDPDNIGFGFGTANGQAFMNVRDVFAYADPPLGEPVGDRQIEYYYPTADATPNDWTPNGVTDGYEALDNVPANASEYVEAAAANDVSVYDVAISDSGLLGLDAVAIQYTARKADASVGDCQASLVSNSVGQTGEDNAMPETFQQNYDPFPVNPDGGGAWLAPDVTALQIQLERTA